MRLHSWIKLTYTNLLHLTYDDNPSIEVIRQELLSFVLLTTEALCGNQYGYSHLLPRQSINKTYSFSHLHSKAILSLINQTLVVELTDISILEVDSKTDSLSLHMKRSYHYSIQVLNITLCDPLLFLLSIYEYTLSYHTLIACIFSFTYAIRNSEVS